MLSGIGRAAVLVQGQLLGHAAVAGRGQHAIADLEAGHALADRGDQARDLAARRERPLGA
jgi:hypothetical protein